MEWNNTFMGKEWVCVGGVCVCVTNLVCCTLEIDITS